MPVELAWEAWFTMGVVGLMFLGLARNYSADLVLTAGAVLIATLGSLLHSRSLPSANAMFSAFGNEALLTIAALFVVAQGITNTGALTSIAERVLGPLRSVARAQARLMFPVAALSAFLNNTAIVAMCLPVLSDWCKRNQTSPAKFFIPLSFATVLGGVCTIIGTSTNLTVNALWVQSGHASFGMFDLTLLGVPVALVGLLYLLVASRWLLPNRHAYRHDVADPREYTVEMTVSPDCALVGRSIEEAGLRHLPGMFLAEVDRQGQVIAAVEPEQQLQAYDRLVFVGVVDSVVDLQKIRGLTPAVDQVFKLDEPRARRVLAEAVVSNSCPLVGSTVREGRFRTRYNAVVIAVARNGERVKKKIGDIVLNAGDTLLLEARPAFVEEQRNSRDFFLVSRLKGGAAPHYEHASRALAVLLGMIVLAGLEWLSMLHAALVAAVLMVATRCITVSEARRSIDLQVLIAIGASLAVGQALATSGAAAGIAHALGKLAAGDAWFSLGIIYVIGLVFTEIMSNNAAVALVYPIAMAVATDLHVSPLPFMFALMVSGSCGFATPIGYQTHMMVYGPGGYTFFDFVRIGVPLDIVCGIVTILLAPFVWPF
jgi:di/tricarboxylate transporter